MSKYHVLLIGIDAYQGAASLTGCVNDIDAIQRILVDRAGIPRERIRRLASRRFGAVHETDVPEEQATLANIRAALEELASDRVAPGDRVFIYYSGHGTQLKVIDPAGVTYVREALLPKDNIVEVTERRYLFDWELNDLLARIARRTRSVAMILDGCCSAGATREAYRVEPRRSAVRFSRSSEPYVLPADRPPPRASQARGVVAGVMGSVSDCQVVTACLCDERARESEDDAGRMMGVLTRALCGELAKHPSDALRELRWGVIWRGVFAAVEAASQAQHPWISGSYVRRVFGGPPEDGDSGYGIRERDGIFEIDAGTLSGITEDAVLGIYPSEPAKFAALDSREDVGQRIGRLRVVRAWRTRAEAAPLLPGAALPAGARARLIRAGAAARLRVLFEPHDASLSELVASSPLLDVVAPGAESDIQVMRVAGGWAVADEVFGPGAHPDEPTLVVVPDSKPFALRDVLEHYVAYSQPLRLAKRSQDLPRTLRVELRSCKGFDRLPPDKAQAPWELPELSPDDLEVDDAPGGGDRICVVVHNDASEPLKVFLIVCQNSGKVTLLGESVLPARGAHAFWKGDRLGVPFSSSLPADKHVGVDRLVVVGTNNRDTSLGHLELSRSFGHVLHAARSRDARGSRAVPSPPELWTSTLVALRSRRR